MGAAHRPRPARRRAPVRRPEGGPPAHPDEHPERPAEGAAGGGRRPPRAHRARRIRAHRARPRRSSPSSSPSSAGAGRCSASRPRASSSRPTRSPSRCAPRSERMPRPACRPPSTCCTWAASRSSASSSRGALDVVPVGPGALPQPRRAEPERRVRGVGSSSPSTRSEFRDLLAGRSTAAPCRSLAGDAETLVRFTRTFRIDPVGPPTDAAAGSGAARHPSPEWRSLAGRVAKRYRDPRVDVSIPPRYSTARLDLGLQALRPRRAARRGPSGSATSSGVARHAPRRRRPRRPSRRPVGASRRTRRGGRAAS